MAPQEVDGAGTPETTSTWTCPRCKSVHEGKGDHNKFLADGERCSGCTDQMHKNATASTADGSHVQVGVEKESATGEADEVTAGPSGGAQGQTGDSDGHDPGRVSKSSNMLRVCAACKHDSRASISECARNP